MHAELLGEVLSPNFVETHKANVGDGVDLQEGDPREQQKVYED